MIIMTRGGAKTFWGVDLPKEIIYLWRDHQPEWQKFTRQNLISRKVEKQNQNVVRKRRTEIERCPAFIWVFHNNTTFFSGWYFYILSYKKDWPINFRHFDSKIAIQAMTLFPCGVMPIIENFEKWMINFSKAYPHKGFNRKKNQGLTKCWVEYDWKGPIRININK